MARAKRHYLPGHIWHITHRCHKKEWLLRFSRDRRRWLQWLFKAKQRYGLVIANYMITLNHIHLLVVDDGDRAVIPRSIQLVAGRVGQEYNLRKNRTGAFWEDRYHATAIESGEHLLRCMVYIDLNMGRAGESSTAVAVDRLSRIDRPPPALPVAGSESTARTDEDRHPGEVPRRVRGAPARSAES